MNSLHSSMHGFAVVAISILIMGAFFVFPALAVPPIDCGGAVPCSCGNRVVMDTVLDKDKDPVVTTVCLDDGLIVTTGVTLDLGDNTIKGSLKGEGIRIADTSTNLIIINGAIDRFYQGIKGFHSDNVLVKNIVVRNNRYFGIVITGDNNRIEDSAALDNGGRGMRIKGNNGAFIRNRAERNSGGYAYNIIGDNARIISNLCIESGSDGIHVDGDNNLFEYNECYNNERHGIVTDDAVNSTFRNNVVKGNNFGFSILG